MKFFLRLLLIVFAFSSCKSQKSTVKKSIEEYQKEGYTLGTINPEGKENCTVVITFRDLDVKYDPVNINDEKFAKFKNKKTDIYFKFLPLRRMNRCEGVSPISLIEVIEK